VCVILLYSVQLGGQRSLLSTTGLVVFSSTQLNYNQSLEGTLGGQKEKSSDREDEAMVAENHVRWVGTKPEYQPRRGNRPLTGLADRSSRVDGSENDSRRFVRRVESGERSAPQELQGVFDLLSFDEPS